MTDDELHLSVGAYLVGALDHHERGEAEQHFSTCRRCRDELADLSALPGLMSRIGLTEALSGPPPVDDAMLERLLVAASRERTVSGRRRWLTAVAASVVALGAVLGGIGVENSLRTNDAHVLVGASGPVHARIAMTNVSNGTSLSLSLSGVPSEERCELVAVSDTGMREVASSWVAAYTGTAVVSGSTSIPYRHLKTLIIETYDGTDLLTMSV